MAGLDQISDQDLAWNREQRTPCMLLLDVSESMSGQPIQELNAGLKVFEDEIKRDEMAVLRCEVSLVTFGGSARLVQEFVSVGQFYAPALEATGNTPMGSAINLALDTLRARKDSYRQHGINYTRPWVFLITDGAPTDPENWPAAGERLLREERDKGVVVFPIGVEGADMSFLARLSSLNPPQKLKGLAFAQFFRWLSTSQTRASSGQAGGSFQMPSQQDWAQVPL
jgi:uncharacterized protein YegL